MQNPLAIIYFLHLLFYFHLRSLCHKFQTGKKSCKKKPNKYAIYAYTHGPVTGSGPSVKPLKYDVAPYWLS